MHVPMTDVILSHEGAELARATLPPGEYVIGREAGVDLHANTPLLSRKHARLTINYDHLLIEDLGSSNGTFVNEQPVAKCTRLFPNQNIRLGDVTLEVHRQRAPSAPGVSLAPAQAVIRRFLPDELLAQKRYSIGSVVAHGAMGAILDAQQGAMKRRVAMKVMRDTGDESGVLRFIDEAQITGQLDHPNIVPIYELGVDEQDQLFYTMKMVRGITLKKVLELLAQGVEATVKKYPLPALLTVFQKVCDALAFAHSKGVIHRDLKPENLMLGDFGSVLVVDWGLAKVIGKKDAPGTHPARSIVMSARTSGQFGGTETGTILGTPAYMSPEQARGEVETLDARSDIYALGAILFEILQLRPVVRGPDARSIVDKVQRGEVEWTAGKTENGKRKAEIPASLLAVCRKALALDPAARYPHVEDLQADLLAYQNGFATSAEKAGLGKQLLLALKRHQAVSIATAAALVALVAISTAFTLRVVSERSRAEKALADLRATAPTSATAARALIEQQQPELALEKVNTAILLDPIEADYHLLRGHILQALGRLDEAEAAYEKVLKLRPTDTSAARNRALSREIQRESSGPKLSNVLTGRLLAAVREQGRLAEALYLGRSLDESNSSALATWQKYLTQLQISAERLKQLPDGSFALDLTDLPIADLTPFARMPITDIKLGGSSGASIRDLTPLKAMKLTQFWADHLAITSIEALRGMPVTIVLIDHCNVADWSPLYEMPLKELHLTSTSTPDFTQFKSAQLESLRLSATECTDLAPLRRWKLKSLIVESTQVSDLTPLREMPLVELTLSRTQVSDLTPLAGLPIRGLFLNLTAITNLNPLRDMPLDTLNIGGTDVVDLSPLKNSPLRGLGLEGCHQLRDLRQLTDLRRLETVIIPKNAEHIEALRGHPTLRRLGYQGTYIVGSPAAADKTVAEFWAEYDAQQKAGAK